MTNASFSEGGGQLKGLTIGYRTDETTAVIATRTATGDIAFMGYDGGWLETARFTNDNKLGIGTNVIYAPSVEYMSNNGSAGFMLRAYKQFMKKAKSEMGKDLKKGFK